MPSSQAPNLTAVRSLSDQSKLKKKPGPIEIQPTPKLQHGLPQKPISIQEENKKKGFYPISWRVIGGGVMIGGKSK
jgi:hypothetical protein